MVAVIVLVDTKPSVPTARNVNEYVPAATVPLTPRLTMNRVGEAPDAPRFVGSAEKPACGSRVTATALEYPP